MSINATHHINRLKQKRKKNLHDYFNKCRKKYEKIQHFINDKTLSKQGMDKNFPNLIKNTYKKPTTDIILNGEKLKASLPRSSFPLSPLFPASY